MASLDVRITMGSTRSERVSPPARRERPMAIHCTKTARAQEAVYDGRDSGQVGDVDLYHLGQAVLGGVFLQVDRRPDTHGDGESRRERHEPQAADKGGEYTRLLGEAGLVAGHECPTEPGDAFDEDLDDQDKKAGHADKQGQDEEAKESGAYGLAEGQTWIEGAAGGPLHQYFSCHLRTNQWPSILADSVSTNSSIATAKIVWYSIEPWGASPRASWTM